MTFNGYTRLEDPLTRGQALGLLLVSEFTAVTSIMGSSLIIYFIIRHKRYKGRDSFSRLMLGVSGADIVLSSWNLTSTYFFPRDVGFHFTFGNAATCSFSGFLAHSGVISGILYNAGLSCNFAASCAGDWSRDKIVKVIEYPTHVIAIVLPFAACTVTACFKFFNTNTGFRICALQSEPYECQEDPEIECVRGKTQSDKTIYDLMYYIFVLMMLVGTLVAVVNLAVVTVVSHRRLQAGVQHHAESKKLKKRLRKLRRRTILYGFSQINTTIWATVVSFMTNDVASQRRLYPFILVSNVMVSIQGTLNAIIFFQLRYGRVRKLFPEAGISTTLGLVLGGEKAQKAYELKRREQEPSHPSVKSALFLSTTINDTRHKANRQGQEEKWQEPDENHETGETKEEYDFTSDHSSEDELHDPDVRAGIAMSLFRARPPPDSSVRASIAASLFRAPPPKQGG